MLKFIRIIITKRSSIKCRLFAAFRVIRLNLVKQFMISVYTLWTIMVIKLRRKSKWIFNKYALCMKNHVSIVLNDANAASSDEMKIKVYVCVCIACKWWSRSNRAVFIVFPNLLTVRFCVLSIHVFFSFFLPVSSLLFAFMLLLFRDILFRPI